jgi:hypothetical protein
MKYLRNCASSLVVAYFLLMGGCAITYNVNPELLPDTKGAALVQQLPLAVGVYIPHSVRSREFSKGTGHVQVGHALATTFEWALSQLFSKVVILNSTPSNAAIQSGLAGAIELANVSLSENQDSFVYEIIFYSPTGEKIDTWSLAGNMGNTALWDIESSSLSASMQSIGTGTSYGIRNQTAQFMLELPSQGAVKNWCQDAKIASTPLKPFIGNPLNRPARNNWRTMILPELISWRYTDHAKAMECVGNHLRIYDPPVEIVLAESIRLDFFPWLEPSTAPKTIGELRTLLQQPAMEQKLHELGIRYLLSIQGGTYTTIPGGGILCGAGMGGGGCFGFAFGTRDSSFTATIVDLQSEEQPREISSKESSGVYVPAFGIPIPLLAPTEASACEHLAKDIHAVISKSRQ